MVKSLYYIQCTAKTDFTFDTGYQEHEHTDFHVGNVVYYNKKTMAREMHLKIRWPGVENPYRSISSGFNYLPFTRKKQWAKRWEKKYYAQKTANIINSKGQFDAVVKEIKMTYEEEEV